MTDNQSNSIHQFDDEINLGEMFVIIWSRKWFILLFVMLSVVLTYNYMLKVPDRFTSSILVMFKESSKNDTLHSVMSGGLTAADNTETELELLKSRRFAGQIVDNLSLIHNVHYQMQSGYEPFIHSEQLLVKNRSHAIDILSSNIKVEKKSGTNLVKISYESHSATHSAVVANEIAKTFVNFKEEIMKGKTLDTVTLLKNKIAVIEKNLLLAERRITDHQNKHGFIDINSALTDEEMNVNKLTQERREKIGSIERKQLLKEQIQRNKLSPEQLFSIPDVSASPRLSISKNRLQANNEAFNQIKSRYGPKHPAYKNAEQLFESAKKEVTKEVETFINSINKKLQLEKSNLNAIENRIQDSKSRLRDLKSIEIDNQKLRSDYNADLKIYENLTKGLKESEMIRDMSKASNLILVENAEVPNSPNNKKTVLVYTLSALVSALLASIIVLIETVLGSKVLQFRKVAKTYNTKILGVIPKIRVRGTGKKPLIKVDNVKHMNFMEALRSTRTNILLDRELASQKVIAITSISPNDGKSTLSIQLARSFSELEKVILVDADLRFPSIGDALGINVNAPGLTNLLAKKSKLSDCICKVTGYKFHALSAGFQSKNPLLFLSQPRLKKVVDALKNNYDRVVLECPPIMSVSDAFVISKHVDSLYLVIDVEKTNQSELTNCLEELAQANINVGGLILNKVKRTEKYYSAAYSKYLKADLSRTKLA